VDELVLAEEQLSGWVVGVQQVTLRGEVLVHTEMLVLAHGLDGARSNVRTVSLAEAYPESMHCEWVSRSIRRVCLFLAVLLAKVIYQTSRFQFRGRLTLAIVEPLVAIEKL
jgi:hypothetical protein